MPGLGDTILNLSKLRRAGAGALANLAEPLRLTLTAATGGNPGNLRMATYVPPGLPPGAALVVVLHGCTQNAAAYDHGAGWSELADRHGFALLFPEQQRGNNANLCFNWFEAGDVTSGRGEVESIRAMVLQMVETHRLDARRVFITGLSAGGAMTAAMLATAPQLFAGGAIIAGLPYGAATSVSQAFSAMGQPRRRPAREWGDLVRAASPHRGPWPAVQVWQGDADTTVNPGNADELAKQWADVMGLPTTPAVRDTIDGARHEAWLADGRPVLEVWRVPGLGHGTPVGTPNTTSGNDVDRTVGTPGPHMLASSISASFHLARSWGLLTQAAQARPAARQAARPETRNAAPLAGVVPPAVGTVVEKALRAAGLLK